MLSKEIFKKGLEDLEIVFDNFIMTKAKADIWYKYSKNLTNNNWLKKIENCIKFCRKIPTLADILDLAGYCKIEQDWSKIKTFKEEAYEHKPIPQEIKEHIKKMKLKSYGKE